MKTKQIILGFLLCTLIFDYTLTRAQGRRDPDPIVKELGGITYSVQLKRRISVLMNSKKESDLNSLASYYYMKNQPEKADEVCKIAIKLFPAGEMAYVNLLNAVGKEKDVTKNERIFAELLKKFPGRSNEYMVDIRRLSLACSYADNKNTDKVFLYISQISNPDVKFMTLAETAKIVSGYDPDSAIKLIKQAIDSIQSYRNGTKKQRGGDPMGPVNNPQAYYCKCIAMYGNILEKKGKSEEALRYIQEAYNGSKDKSATLFSDYIRLLLANKKYEAAMPVMEEMIKKGEASEQIKRELKEIYEKQNPGKSGEEYIATLQKLMDTKIAEEISAKMVNEPAPEFYITDVNGKTVKSCDLKGKTVVLDFWATWCGPCKRSLPAMQMTVNKYKNDSSVKFLFIHTWEKVENPLEDAKSYLTSKGFTFDLYMDLKDPKTSVNNAAVCFKIEAIPYKLVIDPSGNIRFKILGLTGGDDAIVSELSAMIEYCKKEK